MAGLLQNIAEDTCMANDVASWRHVDTSKTTLKVRAKADSGECTTTMSDVDAGEAGPSGAGWTEGDAKCTIERPA